MNIKAKINSGRVTLSIDDNSYSISIATADTLARELRKVVNKHKQSRKGEQTDGNQKGIVLAEEHL